MQDMQDMQDIRVGTGLVHERRGRYVVEMIAGDEALVRRDGAKRRARVALEDLGRAPWSIDDTRVERAVHSSIPEPEPQVAPQAEPEPAAPAVARPRIAKIEVVAEGAACTGLKGQVFSQWFQGVDLLVGPNGSGKTTRGPLGITALIEGLATVPTDPRRPWVGPLPAETLMRAEVVTASGRVTLERDLSAARGRKADAATVAAREAIGVPPTAWDLSDFASGTPGDRSKILDAIARAGGQMRRWSADEAIERVRELMLEALPEGVDESTWLGAWQWCCEHYASAPDGATLLRSALASVEAEQQRRNTEQRQAKGAASQLADQMPQDPGGDADEDERMRRALVRSADEVAEVERAKQALARHLAEGERLRSALSAAESEGRQLAEPADPSVREQLRQHIATLEAQCGASAETEDLERAAREARDRVGVLRAAVEVAEQGRRDAGIERRRANDALLEATRHEAELQSRVSMLDGAHDLDTVCRHCGGVDPLGVGGQIDAATAELDEAKAASAAARKRNAEALQAVDRAEAALRSAAASHSEGLRRNAEADQAIERARADARAKQASRDRMLEAARSELERLEASEARREQMLEAARERWRAARAALTEFEALELPAVPPEPDEHDAEQLAEIEARIEARRRLEAHRDLVRSALERYEAARIAWDASRALVRSVRTARDELAQSAYRPIHEAARAIISGASGLPRPYFRGPDDYGAEVEGHGEVPYAGLSESEQRITAAALVAALATVAGNPCRIVLLDGLEVVQQDHRAALVSALVAAQRAGLVDQVVATMATEPNDPLDYLQVSGVTIHQLEPWTIDEMSWEVGPTFAEVAAPAPAPGRPAPKPVDEVPF